MKYRNNDGTNVTRLADSGFGSAVWADYNNDGYLDLNSWEGSDPSDTESSFRVVASWVEGGLFYIQFLGNDSGDSQPFLMEHATNGLVGGWSVADPAGVGPANDEHLVGAAASDGPGVLPSKGAAGALSADRLCGVSCGGFAHLCKRFCANKASEKAACDIKLMK